MVVARWVFAALSLQLLLLVDIPPGLPLAGRPQNGHALLRMLGPTRMLLVLLPRCGRVLQLLQRQRQID